MSDHDLRPRDRDRGLLMAAAAVRLGLIEPADLVAAWGRCLSDPDLDPVAALRETGKLDDAGLAAIDRYLAVEVPGNDDQADDEGTMITDEVQSLDDGPGWVSGQAAPASSLSDGPSLSQSRLGPRQLGMIDNRVNITAEHPGRYTIKGEHGRGGIGRVLVAFDEHVGRVVALKELLPESVGGSAGYTPSTQSAAAVARFLREARITGQLEHPGIVPVYEIARRPDGSIYYTMKMVHGRTLKERLKECQTLADRLHLLPHYLDLCQSMAYAHSKGVVHRDLKPANVMIGEFGETVVLDWGLAKVRGLEDVRAETLEAGLALVKDVSADATVTGRPIGTPSYMSPEQAEGRIEDIDERSDVWGLGVILYQILTGRPPFVGETAPEVVGKVITEQAEPAGQLEPHAPVELISVAAKCLTKDPAGRYADAGELAKDVANFQAGGLVSAYDYSMTALAVRWLKKYRAIVATASAALAVLLLFGAWSVYNINRQRAIALAQEKIAVEQRAQAETAKAKAQTSERAAFLNLAEAFVQKARMLEEKGLDNEARVYYASALVIRDEPKARSGIYREYTSTLRTRLLWIWNNPAPHQRVHAFSRDGALIAASSCVDKAGDEFCAVSRIDIMDVAAQKPRAVIKAPGDLGKGLAFSPGGETLAAAYCAEPEATRCDRYTLRRYDPATGEVTAESPLRLTRVSSVGSLPEGAFAVTGCAASSTPDAADCVRGGIEIVNFAAAGDTLITGHTDLIYAAAASPDRTMIASAGYDNAVGVWDARTGELKHWLTGHSAYVFAVAFSPDGRTLASGDDFNLIHLWDLPSGELRGSLIGHQDSIRVLDFSPDGLLLASAGDDHTVRLWRTADHALVRTVTGDEDSIRALAFSPTGDRLFTMNLSGVARVWAIAPGRTVTVLAGHGDWVRGVAVSPDGQSVITGGQDQTIRVWDAADGSLRRTVPAVKVYCLALSPDGSRVAAGGAGGEVVVYGLDDGRTVVALSGHAQSARDVRFSSDGGRLLSASEDSTVRWWDLATGSMLYSMSANDSKVFTAALFPDRAWAASGGADRTIHVWDLATGRAVRVVAGLGSDVRYITFSRTAELMAVARGDGLIELRDLETLELARTLTGHTSIVLGADFSPDGRYLVSGGGDRLPRLWRTDTGEQLQALAGHDRYVWSAVFAPDGNFMVTGSGDGTARVWPFIAEVFTLSPSEHQSAALRETGLRIDGFNIEAWDPFASAR